MLPLYINSNSAENLQSFPQAINVVDIDGDWKIPHNTTFNDTVFSNLPQGTKTLTTASLLASSKTNRVFVEKPGTSSLPSPHNSFKFTQANMKIAPLS